MKGSQKTYIYKDIFTGDDMFAACYPHQEVDDAAFLVEGKYVQKGGETFEIGGGGVGEEDDAPLNDSQSETVINIVDAHKLCAVTFTKKDYFAYIKKYLAKVKKHLQATNPDRVKGFMESTEKFIMGKIVKNFDEYTFYMGESMEGEAGMAIGFYKEGEGATGVVPMFYFFKDGVVLSFPGFGKSLEHPVPKNK
eukprot:TRINITY_DN22881_c0_g1_i1.p1 TRINITY_DN22881_c0_g1~~TRINITY_DN22881_c0_g1_i1.p1  ORF type:complete len:194 (+),score=63.68 TRINITY_DN22881_c0_g1_i1:30-611(+)